jgi:serine/threonine protein kinase/CheY-like chemotaxis protein
LSEMTNILVVEDDKSISENLRLLLESQGYGVTVCNDGQDADDVLSASQFDLLMLDWDLPRLTGPEVLQNYRKRGGLAPVLMLTGKRELSNKEFAFDAGADDYLTKPFSLREVAARVKAMLRRTEQITESVQAKPAPEILDIQSGEDPYLDSVFAGKYKLNEKLGAGGSGTVYGAIHLGLNRPVAVKFLHSYLISQAEARQRFEREAKTLSEIKHPSIVEIFDFGIEKGQPFIVLERVSGVPLSKIIGSGGAMKLPEAMKIFEQICDAMEVAHKAGIIHRDLKPENILVDSDKNGAPTIKLVDLGLAKSTRETTKLTETGVTLGTVFYMSPEQCMGKGVDARSDIYSMGCMMFEVLTGAPPFSGDDAMQIFMRHVKEAPPRFASKIADRMKAGRIESVVLRALSKDPAARQQSFAELKKQLPIKGWF